MPKLRPLSPHIGTTSQRNVSRGPTTGRFSIFLSFNIPWSIYRSCVSSSKSSVNRQLNTNELSYRSGYRFVSQVRTDNCSITRGKYLGLLPHPYVIAHFLLPLLPLPSIHPVKLRQLIELRSVVGKMVNYFLISKFISLHSAAYASCIIRNDTIRIEAARSYLASQRSSLLIFEASMQVPVPVTAPKSLYNQ